MSTIETRAHRPTGRRLLSFALCMGASIAALSPVAGCGQHVDLRDSPPEHTVTSTNSLSTNPWTKIQAPYPGGGGPSNLALLTDGSVLCSASETGNAWYRLKPNTLANNSTGSYAAGTWSNVPSSSLGRFANPSFMLSEGVYMICGGEYVSDPYEVGRHLDGTAFARCEAYNVMANSWTPLQDMPEMIRDAPGVVLSDGRVLMLSYQTNHSFVYDGLQSPPWHSVAPYDRIAMLGDDPANPQKWGNEGDCMIMQDGSALCGDAHFSRYVPSSDAWSAIPDPPVSLMSPLSSELGPMLLLQTGEVLVLGANNGPNTPPDNTQDAASAIYTPAKSNPSTGTWTLTTPLPHGVSPLNHGDTPASVMRDGRVLAIATYDQYGNGGALAGNGCATMLYEYDPYASTAAGRGTWTPVQNPPFQNGATFECGDRVRMLNLPNGQVLVTGTSDGSMWLYMPNGAAQGAWYPKITSITGPLSGEYTLTGTQLNGLTSGSNFGDDNKAATNYPIVTLTEALNPVHKYYARSYGFTQQAPGPGAVSSCKFALPPELPAGSYQVQVSASGLISGSFPLTVSGIHVSALNITSPTTATVVLSSAAPSGGTVVALSSSDANALSIPTSVTVPAGSTKANFTATVHAWGSVGIGAVALPRAQAFVPMRARMGWTVSSVSGPSTLYGATARQTAMNWQVSISAPAPANAVIALSSDNPGVGTVPATVTVPAGQTSATFTVSKTSQSGIATITASIRDSSQSYTLNNEEMDFVKCADEGGQCDTLTGNGYIAFGANSSYSYRSTGDRFVTCDATTLGNPGGSGPRACYLATYRYAASQGSSVSLASPRNVAFGANDQFVYRQMTGNFVCDAPTFGFTALSGPNGTPFGYACYFGPDPNVYSFAADEGSTLTGLNSTKVAYGAGGHFTFATLSGNVACNNGTFGDPAVNSVKACYLCSGVGCCLTPSPSNVVKNASFNTGVSGWSSFDPTNILISYQSADATSCSSSGSVHAVNRNLNGENSGFYQCVPVTAGVSYDAGVRVRIASGQPQGQTFMQVAWFTGTGCTGNLNLAALLSASGFDQWQQLSQDNLVAPAGTQSAYVYGQIIKNFPNSQPYTSDFDDFYLTPSPGHF